MPEIHAVVRRCRGARAQGRAAGPPPIRGFLPSLPRVGEPLIVYAPDGDGSLARLITSRVERVLMDPQRRELFVETLRSVYQVTLDEPAPCVPAAPRVRVSFDGFEITVAPEAPTDATNEIETTD